MTTRTNFLMTPAIAFELLTNDYDLVGYQKLLRVVGMNGTWKGGNRALAERLGMSYGRLVKLKDSLKKVEFIRIIPGDAAHGEADTWHVLDIWERNREFTLSRNEQGLSPNEQGLEDGNELNVEIEEDLPCHETDKGLSPNEQATLSRNGQHKEKICLKESCLEKCVCVRAREPSVQILLQRILAGLRKRKNLEILPDEKDYEELAEWAFVNKFTAERVLLCYDTLKRQKWRKSRVKAEHIKNNLPDLDQLVRELDEEEKEPKGGHENQNGTRDHSNHREKRKQEAINDFELIERSRRNAEARRREKLSGSNASDSV